MLSDRGILFIVSGPSGAGKSTLVNRVIAEVPGLKYAVSYTTRPRRETEVEGRDYYFVTEGEFEGMRAQGELIEWAEVYGYLYGRSRRAIEADLQAGVDAMLSIDVQGAASLKRAMSDSLTIFVLPPSFEVLAERLCARGTDLSGTVEQRLEIAKQEVLRYNEFDYIIVNGDLEEAQETLRAVVIAERQKRGRMEREVGEIIGTFR